MADVPPPHAPKTPYGMRNQPKQRRATATVDAILEAAARILVESGYATASTNRIVVAYACRDPTRRSI